MWPNQDAYDAIIRLNAAASEAEVQSILAEYPAVAQDIVKDSSGKYRIYSNKDDANVKYTPYTSVNGGEPSPGQEQTLYYNRPSMETLEYRMKVAKIWNDSLFNDNRLDTVNFKIYEDGKLYATVTLDESKAVSGNAARWESEIVISPGIISDTVANGVRLNAGHTYTVEEEGLDYHYEFVAEAITPMLQNGVMVYLPDSDGDQALTATNHMRGSVTITKKLLDETGQEITQNIPEDEFTLTVTLLDKEGHPITGKTDQDDDAIWYKRLDADGNEVGDASVINSGGTITLQGGHSLRLINVPLGTQYLVTEAAADIPEGYTWVSTVYTFVDSEHTQPAVQSPNAGGNYEAGANTWHYVTVTNTIQPPWKEFSFTKIWCDPIGTAALPWPSDKSITVTIKQDDTDYARYTIRSKDLQVNTEIGAVGDTAGDKAKLVVTAADAATGYTFSLTGLPYGDSTAEYTYYVSEEKVDGYQSPRYFEGETQRMGASQIGNGVIIKNAQIGNVLPSTGGPGTRIFTILGSILILGADVLLWRRRRLI